MSEEGPAKHKGACARRTPTARRPLRHCRIMLPGGSNSSDCRYAPTGRALRHRKSALLSNNERSSVARSAALARCLRRRWSVSVGGNARSASRSPRKRRRAIGHADSGSTSSTSSRSGRRRHDFHLISGFFLVLVAPAHPLVISNFQAVHFSNGLSVIFQLGAF